MSFVLFLRENPLLEVPLYILSFVESIALRRDECTVQKVLKYIARYSHEWYVIGEYLVGHDRRHILEEIKNTFHSDHKAYVVELWYRVDPGRFSWAKLSQALKLVQARRPSATSMGESLTPSLPDELMNIDESLDLSKCTKFQSLRVRF